MLELVCAAEVLCAELGLHGLQTGVCLLYLRMKACDFFLERRERRAMWGGAGLGLTGMDRSGQKEGGWAGSGRESSTLTSIQSSHTLISHCSHLG